MYQWHLRFESTDTPHTNVIDPQLLEVGSDGSSDMDTVPRVTEPLASPTSKPEMNSASSCPDLSQGNPETKLGLFSGLRKWFGGDKSEKSGDSSVPPSHPCPADSACSVGQATDVLLNLDNKQDSDSTLPPSLLPQKCTPSQPTASACSASKVTDVLRNLNHTDSDSELASRLTPRTHRLDPDFEIFLANTVHKARQGQQASKLKSTFSQMKSLRSMSEDIEKEWTALNSGTSGSAGLRKTTDTPNFPSTSMGRRQLSRSFSTLDLVDEHDEEEKEEEDIDDIFFAMESDEKRSTVLRKTTDTQNVPSACKYTGPRKGEDPYCGISVDELDDSDDSDDSNEDLFSPRLRRFDQERHSMMTGVGEQAPVGTFPARISRWASTNDMEDVQYPSTPKQHHSLAVGFQPPSSETEQLERSGLTHKTLPEKPHRLMALKRADWFQDKYTQHVTGQLVHVTLTERDVIFVGVKKDCEDAFRQCSQYLLRLKEDILDLPVALAELLKNDDRGGRFLSDTLDKYPHCGYMLEFTAGGEHKAYLKCAAEEADVVKNFKGEVNRGVGYAITKTPITRVTKAAFEKLVDSFKKKLCVSIECGQTRGNITLVSVWGIKTDMELASKELNSFAAKHKIVTRRYVFRPDDETAIQLWWRGEQDWLLDVKHESSPDLYAVVCTCHSNHVSMLEQTTSDIRRRLEQSAVCIPICQGLTDIESQVLVDGLQSVNAKLFASSIEDEMKASAIANTIIIIKVTEAQLIKQVGINPAVEAARSARKRSLASLSLSKQGATDVQADAIVCHVDQTLEVGKTAVGSAIATKLGTFPTIEAKYKTGGPFRVVPVDIRHNNKLPHKLVLCVVLEKCEPDVCLEKLSEVVAACLKLVEERGLSSIVFPPLGFGQLFDYYIEVVANAMVTAAVSYLDNSQKRDQKVTFCAKDADQVLDVFRREIQQLETQDKQSTETEAPSKLEPAKVDVVMYLEDPAQRKAAEDIVVNTFHNQFLFRKVVGSLADINALGKDVKDKVKGWPRIQTRVVQADGGEPMLEVVGQQPQVNGLDAYVLGEIAKAARKHQQDLQSQLREREQHSLLERERQSLENLVLQRRQEQQQRERKELERQKEQLERQNEELKRQKEEGDVHVPPYWESAQTSRSVRTLQTSIQLKSRTSYLFVQLDASHAKEIEDILNMTRRLLGTVKVKSVHRLENPGLWEKYGLAKKMFLWRLNTGNNSTFPKIEQATKCGAILTATTQKAKSFLAAETHREVNEYLLLHGFKPETRESIAKTGLDFRLAGKGLHGSGIYTAEIVDKADSYTGRGEERDMLLVRVLLGDPYVINGRSGFRRPPCKACRQETCKCSAAHFDSVIFDCVGQSREFIVYDSSQCYPEYFIKYTVDSSQPLGF